MKEEIRKFILKNSESLRELANKIWLYPENSGEEFYAVEEQVKLLKTHGFTVHTIDNCPTAIVAEYGDAGPSIGFIGEYDALPALSQQVCASRCPLESVYYGHGCGHNLIAAGSIGATIALKDRVAAEKLNCRVRYYGCPAEENMRGKSLMLKAGVFSDLDFCLAWHPFDVNKVFEAPTLAIVEFEFIFHGTSSHAAVAPHLGRSALDGVELMNTGVNYLREHIIEQARIHYIITNGGLKPNVVPDEAASLYQIRAPRADQVIGISERVLDIARGAALMSGTKLEYRFRSGVYDYMANPVMDRVLMNNFKAAKFPEPEPDEMQLFTELSKGMPDKQKSESCRKYAVQPYNFASSPLMRHVDEMPWRHMILPGSTDLGDVSRVVPTSKLMSAAWVLGTANHTWQATACSGTRYAADIAMMSGSVLAESAYDILMDKELQSHIIDVFRQQNDGVGYRPLDSMF